MEATVIEVGAADKTTHSVESTVRSLGPRKGRVRLPRDAKRRPSGMAQLR